MSGLEASGTFLATFAAAAALMAIERFLPVPPSVVSLVGLGVAATQDAVPLAAMVAGSIFGSLAGAALWFGLGRALGRQLFARRRAWLRWTGVTSERVEKMRQQLAENGLWPLGVAQLVPTVRILAPFTAAAAGLGWRQAGLATLGGIAVYNTVFIALGYTGVHAAQETVVVMADGMAWAVPLLLVLIAGGILLQGVRRRQRSRVHARRCRLDRGRCS